MPWWSSYRTELHNAVASLDPGKVREILKNLNPEKKSGEVNKLTTNEHSTLSLLIENKDKCNVGNETFKGDIFDLLIPYADVTNIDTMFKTYMSADPSCISDLFKTKIKNWIATQNNESLNNYYPMLPSYYNLAQQSHTTAGIYEIKKKREKLYTELINDFETKLGIRKGGKRKTRKLRKKKTLLKKTDSSRF